MTPPAGGSRAAPPAAARPGRARRRPRCRPGPRSDRGGRDVRRQRLRELNDRLTDLYAGNPKRTTTHLTAESLLHAFKGLPLSFVTVAGQTYRHITPLFEVQHKILRLLDYPSTIYTELAVNSANSP